MYTEYNVIVGASLLFLVITVIYCLRLSANRRTWGMLVALAITVLLLARAAITFIAAQQRVFEPTLAMVAAEVLMLVTASVMVYAILTTRTIMRRFHADAHALEARVAARTAELQHASQQLQAERERSSAALLALDQAQAVYTLSLDKQTDRISRYRPDGTITFVNRAYCEVYNKQRSELIGANLFELIPPERANVIQETIAQLSPDIPQITKVHRFYEGDILLVERWLRSAIFDDDGKLIEIQAIGRDITAETLAQAALHENEERMRRLVERLPLMVLAISDDDRVIMWNHECERVTGYSAETLLNHPDPFALLYPDPAYRAEIGQRFAELDRHFQDVETTITTQDGEQRVIAWTNISREQPIPGWDRWVTGVDVTARKQAASEMQRAQTLLEQQVASRTAELETSRVALEHEVAERLRAEVALRQSENRLRTTLDALDDIVYVVRRDMRVVLCNRAFMEFVRDSGLESNPIGRTVLEIFPFLPRSIHDDNEQVFQTGEMLTRKESMRIGQLEIINDTRKIPIISDDEVTHVVTVIHDITERERFQAALSASEEKFRRLVELSPDGIRLVDRDGTIVEWNRGNELITGLAREDVIGRPLWEVLRDMSPPEMIRSDMVARTRELIDKFLQGEDIPPPTRDYEIVRPDGSRRVVQTIIFPIETETGRMAGGITRDVTERKQAEQAIRISEARYRALSEVVTDFAFAVRYLPDGRPELEWITEALTGIAGYTPDEVAELDKWRSVIHPDDMPVFERAIENLTNGQIANSELRIYTRSGQERWIRASARPETDPESGATVRITGGVKDITEQKLAERARIASEQKFRRFVEESLDGIHIVDGAGTIIEWNRANEQITGIPRMTAIGRSAWDVMHLQRPPHLQTDAELERLRQTMLDTLRTGNVPPQQQTYALSRPDGETRYVQTVAFLIQTDQGRLVGNITRDVTEEISAQNALRENEQRLRTLINATPDIICVKDEAGRWLIANDADLALFELQHVDYVGKTDAELAEHTPFYHDALKTCIDTDEAAWEAGVLQSAEETIPRPNGPPRIYDVIKVPLFDEDGNRKELVVFGRDITERKRAEEQSVQLALEQERSTILSAFIRDTSHEFANPLSVLKNNIYLAQHVPERERVHDLLEGMRGQIFHLEKLVEGLMTMSQLDGGIEFHLEPVSLRVIIAALYESGQALGHQKNHTIELHAPDNLPDIQADTHYLPHALRELVTNAVQYTPEGGTVTINVEVTLAQVVITVRDTGIGIAPEDQEHIFERFYRVDKARSQRGAGLGLAIARHVIERHGGQVTVESAPGSGSTFRVFLPI